MLLQGWDRHQSENCRSHWKCVRKHVWWVYSIPFCALLPLFRDNPDCNSQYTNDLNSNYTCFITWYPVDANLKTIAESSSCCGEYSAHQRSSCHCCHVDEVGPYRTCPAWRRVGLKCYSGSTPVLPTHGSSYFLCQCSLMLIALSPPVINSLPNGYICCIKYETEGMSRRYFDSSQGRKTVHQCFSVCGR